LGQLTAGLVSDVCFGCRLTVLRWLCAAAVVFALAASNVGLTSAFAAVWIGAGFCVQGVLVVFSVHIVELVEQLGMNVLLV
jgi:hypothetical protein